MTDKKITIFTMTGCPHCKAAKEFLDKHDVSYNEKNVAEDDAAEQEFEEKGFSKVPVILTGDETITGFDEDRVAQALDLR